MKKAFLLIGVLATFAGCYNDKGDKLYPAPATTTTTCDTTSISYATDITPIINSYCAISGGCHDATGATASGYNFTIYATLAGVANNGMLIDGITGNGYPMMPLAGAALSQCNINKIERWVHEGAPDN